MSRFRKVDAGTWGDERFASLSDNAKLLWFYLLTGPNVTSLPGVLVVGRATLSESLGWSPRKLDACMSELQRSTQNHAQPMVVVEWKQRIVFLPGACRYNHPSNPKVVLGWRDAWRCVPEGELKAVIESHLRSAAASWGEEYLNAFNRFTRPESAPPPSSRPDTVSPLSPHTEPDTNTHTLSYTNPHTNMRARAQARPAPAPALSLLVSEGGAGGNVPECARPADETQSGVGGANRRSVVNANVDSAAAAGARTRFQNEKAPDTDPGLEKRSEGNSVALPETRRAPRPEGIPKYVFAENRVAFVDAYVAAVREVTGVVQWTMPPFGQRDLEALLANWCTGAERGNPEAWIDRTVRAFAESSPDGYEPSRIIRFLNNQATAGSRARPSPIPRQPVPVDDLDDDPVEPITPEQRAADAAFLAELAVSPTLRAIREDPQPAFRPIRIAGQPSPTSPETGR